jgi:hypothetical protein
VYLIAPDVNVDETLNAESLVDLVAAGNRVKQDTVSATRIALVENVAQILGVGNLVEHVDQGKAAQVEDALMKVARGILIVPIGKSAWLETA